MALPKSVIQSRQRWQNSFIGYFSKDIDPPNQTYTAGASNVLAPDGTISGTGSSAPSTWVFGEDVHFVCLGAFLPAGGLSPSTNIRINYGFRDDSESTGDGQLAASSASSSTTENFQTCMNSWLGGINAFNDAEQIGDLSVVVDVSSGSDPTRNYSTIRIRGALFLRGGGTAP